MKGWLVEPVMRGPFMQSLENSKAKSGPEDALFLLSLLIAVGQESWKFI